MRCLYGYNGALQFNRYVVVHIILGALVVVTILVLLNRLQEGGIDIGWLNPFAWKRRRDFRKKYQAHPAYSLSDPMDVAALFMLAVAKADGEITKQQKDALLNMFESEFKLSSSEANALLGSSSHILGNGKDVQENPKKVISKSIDAFTPEQLESMQQLLQSIAAVDGEATANQTQLIHKISAVLPVQQHSKW